MRLGEPNKNRRIFKWVLPIVFTLFIILIPQEAHAVFGIGEKVTAGFTYAVNSIISFGVQIIWKAGALALSASGKLLNLIIMFTIEDFPTYIRDIPAITTAWKVFRDISNIFLVFILLYIGVSTIIRDSNFKTNQLLGRSIVVALLLNFSFLLSAIVIDASNILTLIINKAIVIDAASDGSMGIANAFTNALKMSAVGTGTGGADMTAVLMAVMMLFFQLIVAVVFLFVSLLLISRAIILIFLVILSPIAVASTILDSHKQKIWSDWWGTLLNQAFFLPAMFLFFWISLTIIKDDKFDLQTTWHDLLSFQTVDILFNLVLVLGLMIGGIILSRKIAGGGSKMAQKFASNIHKTIGGVAIGGAAFAGRNVVGRGAGALANTETFKNRMPALSNKFENLSKKTFDARNSKSFEKLSAQTMGDKNAFGEGTKKSYASISKQKLEDSQKEMKKRYSNVSDTDKYKSLWTGKTKQIMGKDGVLRDMTYAEVYAEKKRNKLGNKVKSKIADTLDKSGTARLLSLGLLDGMTAKTKFKNKAAEKLIDEREARGQVRYAQNEIKELKETEKDENGVIIREGLDDKEKRQAKTNKDILEQEGKIAQANADIANIVSEIARKQNLLNDPNLSSTEKSNLRSEINQLHTKNTQANQTKTDSKRELNILNSKKQTLDTEVTSLKQSIKSLTDDISDMIQDMNERNLNTDLNKTISYSEILNSLHKDDDDDKNKKSQEDLHKMVNKILKQMGNPNN